MSGRHAAPDRRRFYRELLRLALMLIVLAVVAIGGAVWISSILGGSDDTIPVALTETQPTTSVLAGTLESTTSAPTTTSAPSSTAASTSAASTTSAPSTTSTTASTTTSTTVATTTSTTLPPIAQPAQITVLVLNSTTTVGMAGRVTDQLADLGYITLEADNYRPRLDTSVVWHVAGFDREAAVVAEALIPDAIVEPLPEGEIPQADITIVLGASFNE